MLKQAKQPQPTFRQRWRRNWAAYKYVYWMLLPILAYYIIFHYIPMLGSVIAFQNYKPALGIMNSKWVGLKHFQSFFRSPYAARVIINTLLINGLQILFGFPAPIIFALLLSEVRRKRYRQVVQTVSYMPHFVSLVVICGILTDFTMTDGLLNDVVALFGGERTNLLNRPELFKGIYVASGIWQNIGWGSIIYLATLTNVDPSLHEAAAMDGASRFQRMLHVSLPALAPIIVIQLIMRVGNILTQGHEKVILLYRPLTYETADIISSYLYRRGLQNADYSFGTAVSIFNSVVNLVILVSANAFSRKVSETSLW
ncbi:MAG: ABC transporter permease [Aristaeellaceae bacterium]